MIYLFREEGTDDYKIGKTKDELNKGRRRGAQQTGNPNKIVIVASWEGSVQDEHILHRVLKRFQCDGGSEWFTISLALLLEALMIEARQHEVHLGNPIRHVTGVEVGDYGLVLIHEGRYKQLKGLYDDDDGDFAVLNLLESGNEVRVPYSWITRRDRIDS